MRYLLTFLTTSLFIAGDVAAQPIRCAVGSVEGWGRNNYGQATPPPGSDFVAIAGGDDHSLALRADGTIVCWGDNSSGQLNNIPTGNDFVAIAAGDDHSLALRADGSILGWGLDNYGQATPPPGSGIAAIAAGDDHNLALRADGTIVCFGSSYSCSGTPTGNDFAAIACGEDYSVALRTDGSIVDWGPRCSQSGSPRDPPSGDGFLAIAAASDVYGLALKTDGSLVHWYCPPRGLPTGNGFVAISAGYWHGLALRVGGSIVGWGDNNHGQATPPSGNDFVAIDAAFGGDHSLAIRASSSNNLIVYGNQPPRELWGNQQYDAVCVINGGSLTVPEAEWNGSTWIGGYLMLEAETIYVDSNSSIHADACGFHEDDGLSDGGPGTGQDLLHAGGASALKSGDGAGYGGRGGHYWTTVGSGGVPYSEDHVDRDDTRVDWLFGSQGGDLRWQQWPHIDEFGPGGRGGGYVRLRGSTVMVEGRVTANGGDGWPIAIAPNTFGGGGGSGGQIVLDSPNLTVTGTVEASGGDGSYPTSEYSGGGGAGGRIKVLQPSSGICGGTFSVAGGAGCNGMGVGEAGTIPNPSAIPSAVPAISGLVNDSGREPDDLHTSDPRIAGTAEVGSIVRLYIAGLSVGAGEADGVTGEFSVAANAAPNGLIEVTATAQAQCKSESGMSAPFIFTLDRQAPDPPSAPDLIEDALTGGQATNDDIVSTATPTFAGTTEPDAEVKLYEGETELGGLITPDGVWTITSIPLAEGTHLATAKATDLAGNESGVSSPLSILIDLTPPEITSVTVAPTGCVPLGRVFDLSMNLSDALSGIGVSWPPQAIIHGGSLNDGIDLAPVGGSLYRGTWDSEGTEPDMYSVDFEGFDIAGNRELLENAATICLARPGDHDFDGDTDLLNFGRFQTCFTGNTGSAPSGCEMMDMDGNGTVDITDFATFHASLGGPH